MKNKRLQSAIIHKDQLNSITGGYKYVSGAAEAASFIGTAVDIRLGLGKEDTATRSGFTNHLNIILR